MRIPSQFNDNSLYGRRGARRPPAAQSYRRLIRLGVALALVVAVMRQASQPEMYETFFGSPEVESADGGGSSLANPSDGEVSGGNVGTENAGPGSRLSVGFTSVTDESTSRTARSITQALSLNEQRQWTVVLDQWQSGERFRVIEPMVSAVMDLLEELPSVDADDCDAWQSTLKRFRDVHASPDPVPPDSGLQPNHDSGEPSLVESSAQLSVVDHVRLNAWLAELDRAANNRVVDGAIWRSEDFDAFYRQLDQAATLDVRGAVSVSVVPLMQQPQTYLGSKVRVKGRVARANKMDASSNPFGVKDYWQLWVRPSSGGDRPFVLIVPSVPRKVGEVGADATAKKGPEIQMVGKFFKRLAYASSYGADAAPVVVGRILGHSSVGDSQIGQAKRRIAVTPPHTLNRLTLAIVGALVFGVAVAALVMWRTSVSGRHARRLREQRKPSDRFFAELTDRKTSPNHVE